MTFKIGNNLKNYITVDQDGSIIIDKKLPSYHRWYNVTTRNTMINIVQELKEFLEDAVENNSYVQIIPGNNPIMRDGSIGTIESLNSILFRLNDVISCLNNQNMHPIDLEYKIKKYSKLEIKFDKKHSSGLFSFDKIKFLNGYTGPVVYINEKAILPKKEIILKDKFDNDLKEGSFICFATSTSRQQGVAKFGKITSIKNENLFYAKNIKLSESDYVSEYTLRYPKDVILMNDELMDNITMARLSI